MVQTLVFMMFDCEGVFYFFIFFLGGGAYKRHDSCILFYFPIYLLVGTMEIHTVSE